MAVPIATAPTRGSLDISGREGSVFRRQPYSDVESQDDEAELRRAALETIPERKRHRAVVVPTTGNDPNQKYDVVRLDKLKRGQGKAIVERALGTVDQDNETFLRKLKQRMDRADVQLAKVQVRFENLSIVTKVHLGSRATPSLANTILNILEDKVLLPLHLKTNTKRNFSILQNMSGTLNPGRLTLLLGPPGSGKTTLLKALAGKLADNSLNISGTITYNGRTFKEFVPQRTAAYIEQVDNHTAELTVRETMDFAGVCQGVGHKYENLQELQAREKELGVEPDHDLDTFLKAASMQPKRQTVVTDYMLKLLGLDVCADTIIGGESARGISGGQRKRVTTGELIVGPKKTLFMDEISTGLDASTTFSIVKAVRNFVHYRDATVLMALLQPPPETYELFDDIMLLSEGHIVFYGRRDEVVPFFEDQGFRCPVRKNVADFLQEVTSRKDQEQYWAGDKPYRYKTVAEFAAAFKRSHAGHRNARELRHPYDRSSEKVDALVHTEYALTTGQMLRTIFWRDVTLLKRNTFLYAFRTFQVAIMGFFTCTLFLRTTLSPSSLNDGTFYLGALFFSLIHMMFNGFSEMSIMVGELPVFYKQRDNKFFSPWAWAVSGLATRMPFSLMEAIVWSALVYYPVGFAPGPAPFFRFLFLMFLVHQMAVSLFRFIGATARSQVVANTLGTLALVALFVLGGFILAKDYIPPWWIWGFWMSPLMYAQQSVATNEFTDPRWGTIDPAVGTTLGIEILGSRSLFLQAYWIYIGWAGLIFWWAIFNVGTVAALTFLNPYGKPTVLVAEETLALREREQNAVPQDEKYAATGTHETVDGPPSGDVAVIIPEEDTGTAKTSKPQQQQQATAITAAAGTPAAAAPDYDIEAGGTPAVEAGRPADGGMVLPFQPLAMTFQDVNYYVPNPNAGQDDGPKELRLLNDVSGAFKPGVLTALVGASGAGKTTLMDVLAGRKTGGRITGTITIDGHPKVQSTFSRISGYVEQEDIHSPQMTVRDSLRFSARTRLSGVDTARALQFVDEVMELVELAPLSDALVGLPGQTGLSVEQRKRLTIAVELVANPSIIFMDEPTSGLDARAAAIVMRAVRNTVNTGRTVVCTIHQPSIDIFESFDELLLMKRGGRIIYFGPLGHHSAHIVDYFQAIKGVPRIAEGYNPATWMLDVSTPSAEERNGIDFAAEYDNSDLYRRNKDDIQALSRPKESSQPLHFDKMYAQPSLAQFRIIWWKLNQVYWRSPQYNLVRFAMATFIALLFGSIFWGQGTDRGSRANVLNIMGALYAAVLFLGVQNSSTVQPILNVERTVFYRERAAGMYAALPYGFALGLVELPYVLVETILYAVITYSMIQFEWTAVKFFWYLFFMFLSLLYFTFYGMTATVLAPSLQMTAVLSSFFYSLWNLFAGFLITRPAMPAWWVWYYYINPVAWTLYGLIGSQLGDVQTLISETGGGQQTVAAFVEQYFGYQYSFLGEVAAILIGFVITFWLCVALGLKFINYRRR